MTEQQLLSNIEEANRVYTEAKWKMSKAKKIWMEAETGVIEAKLALEKAREQLRTYRNTTTNRQLESRELEIKSFRERNPEIVEFARQRDQSNQDEE